MSPTTDRRFAAVVAALGAEDPRFLRRVSRPRPGRPDGGHLMLGVGLLLTLVLGVVPLAVGLHLQVTALLLVGAIGCAVLPPAGPLTTRAVLRRVRPLWLR